MLRQLIKLAELLPKVLRGEFTIDLDRGVVELQGMRIVSVPATTLVDLAETIREVVGDGVYVILRSLGRSLAKNLARSLGDASIDRIVEVAKLAGFGNAVVSGGELVIRDLPIAAPEYAEYVAAGFFEELLGREVPVRCSGDSCVVRLA